MSLPTFSHSDDAAAKPVTLVPDEAAAALRASFEEPAEHAPANPPPPEPLFAGTYAVYDDGAQGVVLVLRQKGGETVQKHLPARLLKMAETLGGGGVAGLFGRL